MNDSRADAAGSASASGAVHWRRVILGWLAVVGLPALLLLDTEWAKLAGWKLASAVSFRWLVLLAVRLCGLLSLALFSARLRAGYARHAGRFALFTLAVLVGVLLTEGVAAWIAPAEPFHGRRPGTRFEFEPDPFRMPGVSGHAVSSINAHGLRGAELPPRDGARRVLCIGGSSTECYYLDDAEWWPAQLGNRLTASGGSEVWLGAAAVSDYATGHHRRYLDTAAVAGDMDVWIVVVGVNDWLRELLGYDAGAVPPMWFRSAAVRLTREVWNGRLANGFVVDSTGEHLWVHRRGFAIPARRPPDLAPALEAFASRLRAIVEVARRRRVKLLLVPQPVLWDDFLTPQGRKRLHFTRLIPFPRPWTYLTPGNFRDVIEQYQQRVLDVARQEGVAVGESVLQMNGQERYFYDDFHLNEPGCARFAELLFDSVAPLVEAR